jgi:hypothetical protein
MADLSELDSRYFIDQYVYNCPFCNRRNVSYSVFGRYPFDWTPTKECFTYRVQCHSCKCTSLHLSFDKIEIHQVYSGGQTAPHRFIIEEGESLDDKFFYSVPISFFVLDDRIPRVLRELISEAEACLKSNLLTGASACARKLIYELARIEKAEGPDYESRLKSLKAVRTDVEPEFFDTLLTIQQVTSDKVHEQSYDGWESKHLRLILATVVEILNAMYVIPKLRKEKRKAILDLREKILSAPKTEPKT